MMTMMATSHDMVDGMEDDVDDDIWWRRLLVT